MIENVVSIIMTMRHITYHLFKFNNVYPTLYHTSPISPQPASY